MAEKTVVWSSMQGTPGEEKRRLSALEIQEQLVAQSQDILLAARNANAAAAAARMGASDAGGTGSVGGAMPAAQQTAISPSGPSASPGFEPDGPDDPDDPENRIMNPGIGVGAYASLLVPPEKEALPPEDAIALLFQRMKAYKAHLLAILDVCREERTVAEVDAALDPAYECCKCPYSPIALRKMLVEAGALDYVEPDEESPGAFSQESDLCTEDGGLDFVAENATANDSAGNTDGDPSDGCSADDEPDASNAQNEHEAEADDQALSGSIYDKDGYLVIEEGAEDGLWLTTSDGLAYMDGIDPEQEFHAEVARHADVKDVFYDVLAYCQQGRNITDIVKRFENDPRLGADTFYASHVVDKLEEIGALSWKKNWIITDLGKKLLTEWEAR